MKLKTNIGPLLHNTFGDQKKIFVWLIPLVLIAKVIRYTILKVSLVDHGVWQSMLPLIVSNNAKFGIFTTGNDDSVTSANANDNASFIFQIFNIFKFDSLLEFEIAITVIFNIIIFILILRCKTKYDTLQSVFLALSVVMLNIFCFTLSKEPIQMLYFILIFLILQSNFRSNKTKLLLTLLIIVFSVSTFRIYYILILYFGIVFYLSYEQIIKKIKNIHPIFKWIIVFICMGLAYVIFLNILKIVSISSYNELLRVRFRLSTAVTGIKTIFQSSENIKFTIDYLIIVLRLLFPIELLRFGFRYILYIICQLVITAIYIKTIKRYSCLSFSQKLSFLLYTGFLFLSAVFEPDFGSWVRHEAVLFPIILIMGGFVESKNQLKNKEYKNEF